MALSVVVLPAPLAPIRVDDLALRPRRRCRGWPRCAVVDGHVLDLKKHLVHPQVGGDHRRVVADLGRRALGDLAAELEHDDPVGDPHDQPHVVLDEQDRVARSRILRISSIKSSLLGRVEARGRLVEAEQLGSRGHRSGDLQPPLVAVGQAARPARPAAPMPTKSSSSMARRALAPLRVRWLGSRNSAMHAAVWCCASAPTSTFSSAVISGNSRMFWNVRAMPELGDLVPLHAGERPAP